MGGNWETEQYKKWMKDVIAALTPEYRGMIKNCKNTALCTSETLTHLKPEIMRTEMVCSQMDDLFNNYRTSDKSAVAKKNLEKSLREITSKEHLAFGQDDCPSDKPVTLAFNGICEKISSIKLEDVPSIKIKKTPVKPKKVTEKKTVTKKIPVNKTQSAFLLKLHEQVGNVSLNIKKNRNGVVILENNNVEITRSIRENKDMD